MLNIYGSLPLSDLWPVNVGNLFQVNLVRRRFRRLEACKLATKLRFMVARQIGRRVCVCRNLLIVMF